MEFPPTTQAEMAQFFDFTEAAMAELHGEGVGSSATTSNKRVGCPAHGDDNVDGCLCHGFHEDIDLPDDLPAQQNTAEWNSDFSSWLPRYHKPDQPCDYCRSRSLECFIYDVGPGSTGCSPCNALFRSCSFTQPKERSKTKTALDTLDLVPEDNARCFGGLTGKKQMRCLGHVGPIEEESEKGPKKGAAAARFPRAAVKVLKDWMERHVDHPYPTEEDKELLKEKTGLTISQISNWMANTRRRQKSRPKRCASPSIRPNTGAIDIPAGQTWDTMNPFERWKHSPPENEPAPLTAIAKAVEDFDLPEPSSSSSSYSGRKGNSNGSSGSFSVFKAPSISSLETGWTNRSSGSGQSYSTAWSHGSLNSFGSLTINSEKMERRRRRRVPTRPPKVDLDSSEKRIFQCTFCTDKFKSKYDWSRHEKSLHLSLEKWICAPIGPVITCSSSGQRKCVYCDETDPSKDHLEIHNHDACESKGLEARTFYRKDHLRQHLRLMHGCKLTSSMEAWKAEVKEINCRCGFCGLTFTKWQDRIDHLAKEFRNGATMKNWKGCRGLDPQVASHVMNAMPPYLIANEQLSPFPFSASNQSSMTNCLHSLAKSDLEYLIPGETSPPMLGLNRPNSGSSSTSPTSGAYSTPQFNPNDNRATCWEILTLRLGRFAREHMEKHGANTVTDEMLQTQARHILYDSDDPWNQTAADNPEWLKLFKQSHGISTVPLGVEKKYQNVLEDLGITETSNLDPSFDLSQFMCQYGAGDTNIPFECSLTGSMNISKAIQNFNLNNLPTTTFTDLPDLTAPIPEIPCTTSGEPVSLQSFENENHFQLPDWDRLPGGFSIPSSTAAGINVSMPAAVQASAGNPQIQRWDDSELDFGLDMDMDIDMNLSNVNVQT